jgi:uncharacterized protein (UPF0548 family)
MHFMHWVIVAAGPTLTATLPYVPPIHLGIGPPPEHCLRAAIEAARQTPMSVYQGSTETAKSLPRHGWWLVQHVRRIGHGREALARAQSALDHLDLFEQDWLCVRRDGDTLVVASRQLGFVWLLNANRVLWAKPGRSISFGTTQRHLLAGEECIEVRLDESTGAVELEIRSLSRPRHPLSWLTYPYVLAQQRRFAADATRSMRRFCEREREADS